MDSLLSEPLIPDFNYQSAVEAALSGWGETAHAYVCPVDDGTEQTREEILRWSRDVLFASEKQEESTYPSSIAIVPEVSQPSSATSTPHTSPVKLNSKRKASIEVVEKENNSPWKLTKRAKLDGSVSASDSASSENSYEADEELDDENDSGSEYNPSIEHRRRRTPKPATLAQAKSQRGLKVQRPPQSAKTTKITARATSTAYHHTPASAHPVGTTKGPPAPEDNSDNDSDSSSRRWGSTLSSLASDDSDDEEEEKQDHATASWKTQLSSLGGDNSTDAQELGAVVNYDEVDGRHLANFCSLSSLSVAHAVEGGTNPAAVDISAGHGASADAELTSQLDSVDVLQGNNERDENDADKTFNQWSDITGVDEVVDDKEVKCREATETTTSNNDNYASAGEHVPGGSNTERVDTAPKNKLKKNVKPTTSTAKIVWRDMTAEELKAFCKQSLGRIGIEDRHICKGFADACGHDYGAENVFKRHLIDKHSDTVFQCDVDGCSYSTSRSDLLKKHLAVHRPKSKI